METTLASYFVGREAYRRTEFIVVRNGSATAIVAVGRKRLPRRGSVVHAHHRGSVCPVGPGDCVLLRRRRRHGGPRTALARVALERAPRHHSGVAVRGRYSRVSFIIDAAPLQVTVREVAPPHRPSFSTRHGRVLDVAEHLPPIEAGTRRSSSSPN